MKKILQNNRADSSKRFINTYCIFGWISENHVVQSEIAISKKLPYICISSKKPYIKPFRDVLKTNHTILLVLLDHKTAHIRLMYGDKVLSEQKLSINLQGRHKKGGQSQKRFLRARQTYIQSFFKKITKKLSVLDSNDVSVLFLGGVGTAKIELHDELNSELKSKTRFIDNVTFSTPTDTVNKKIIKHLYDFRKKRVLDMTLKFEKSVKANLIAKDNSKIQKALKLGAVDTLLITANYFPSSLRDKKITAMIEQAENTSSNVEFVTNPKLVERLAQYDNVLALLRYPLR